MEDVNQGTSASWPIGEPHEPPPVLKDSVKLVIWDLDDTFWAGTLSEGPVEIDHRRSSMVRQLNRRGIINSICSKNDSEAARERLMAEDGLWDEFVFTRIAWLPKGPRIAEIIEEAQLRPEQVLFIDDNVGNLEEARYYAPGIQTSGPGIVAGLLEQPQLAGQDDPHLVRLSRYRLLAHRAAERSSTEGSNEDFLRSCNIRVLAADNCLDEPQFERIAELMHRTNQLNYTKRRLEPGELRGLLADPSRVNRYVQVNDRYGDYGIVGFYSISEGRLTDFFFSCRILNMGVEQWIYASLGFPPIDVRGEVATPLQNVLSVDWINQSSPEALVGGQHSRRPGTLTGVLLKGGCDLAVVNDFLGGILDTEFNVTTLAGVPEHRGHTEVIRRSRPEVVAEFGWIIDRLPFLDRSSYDSKVFSAAHYGVLVLSVLTDYTQGVYRFRGTDFMVPFGVYEDDFTDLDHWRQHPEGLAYWQLELSFIEWFAENFEFIGPLNPQTFKENIRWLANAVPRGSRLVLLNGAELPGNVSSEAQRNLRHREMNLALEEVVQDLPNATILDVRQFISSRDDFADSIVRYRRRVYFRIAEAIGELADADVQVKRITVDSARSLARGISSSVKKMLPPRVLHALGELRESFQRS